MKITEHHKQHTTFLFGKIKGMNNREASRLTMLVPQNLGINQVPSEAMSVYFQFAKEPSIDRASTAYTIVKEGVEKKSRSKLVMEYEKHRKLFKLLCEARNTIFPAESIDKQIKEIVKKMNIENFNNITIDDKFKIMEMLKEHIRPQK